MFWLLVVLSVTSGGILIMSNEIDTETNTMKYDLINIPQRFIAIATAALDNQETCVEIDGNLAIASDDNSSEAMTVAIWEAGSSTDGEADFYYKVQA